MCKHKQEVKLALPLDVEGMGRALWQEMGGEAFDNAYRAAGSPRVKGLGKGFSCSCDLIEFVDENIDEISKISKKLGCKSEYRALVGLTCYIDGTIKRVKKAA